MPSRLPPLRRPPIGFAHRGGRAHAAENTVEAFASALDMGATGLESDVWLTADGVPVLDHDGAIGMRRRRIRTLERAALPSSIPSLEELYAACGTSFELSLDVYDADAAETVVSVARAAGGDAAARLWLCHSDVELVAGWRSRFPDVRLVDSTRLRQIKEGPERRAARLAAAGIDALNLHYSDWTGGHTTLVHRFGVLAFGWDANHDRVLDELLDMGIDGVFSDHVDRMMAAVARLA
ncbi:MAG: glycerophosphodiester phosphodiesterase [Acidimicrobiales bacterium]